jgi:hypothetical protein
MLLFKKLQYPAIVITLEIIAFLVAIFFNKHNCQATNYAPFPTALLGLAGIVVAGMQTARSIKSHKTLQIALSIILVLLSLVLALVAFFLSAFNLCFTF